MNRLSCIVIMILACFCLLSCSPNFTESKNPVDMFPISVDVSDVECHVREVGRYGRLVPISYDELVYIVNGWDDYSITNMKASVYSISPSNGANRLFSILNYHIKQIIPFKDCYILVLQDVYSNRSTGITLMCVDSEWKEKWFYLISDGMVSITICSNNAIIGTYSLTEEYAAPRFTILDENGKTTANNFMVDGEYELYTVLMEEKESVYTVVRKSREPGSLCALKIFDDSLALEFEMELPVNPDYESIVSIVSANNTEYVLTDRKIFEISGGVTFEKASVETLQNLSWAKGDSYSTIPFYKFSESDHYYLARLSKGSFDGIVSLSHNSDFSDIEVRSYGSIKKILCAYVDEKGYLVMITEEDIGKLNLIKWEQ